ncbi:ferredoxin--NADP reductase [Oharaeibacter diazotrophicus]|uniref:ferredoxin--NADP(+) reductase n=1 Tax=Oharaeibacter diazotrophicus TaxID=1920512 RepID=A0A4R6RF17_9HYPH|nr:ferredoxin--NADP reductase [Oharaeibacter diazotrophicus]TDP84883.1 ferredoxin--NADP+ reductase [Oharaeibacter diazotrophicus]BBE73854.1 ferredoxin-NADP reductase [Pleomorphomonas sp. SM30]GLS76461.1 ferredoxin--NADP(+) reductase [Oharaeibacter diazotrophicus]
MAAFDQQRVLAVRHWTDRLFSFRTTRDRGFRFENGQFVMIGLEVDGRPLVRAYSIASANYEDELGFYSIKVPNGPLTSRLQSIAVGDMVLVGRKPTGTLVQDSLKDGRRLYLVSTGTGLAPFVSVIRDPVVYERFESVVLIHGCRFVDELAYGRAEVEAVKADEVLAEMVAGKLLYYPTVTREPFAHTGRVNELLRSGKLPADLGLPALDPADDRVMICGSEAMLADVVALMKEMAFDEGSTSRPGTYVIEKAFAEK